MSTGIPVDLCAGRAIRSSCRWPWRLAETLPAADIFLGVNALDYSGYPDCRPEYIEAFERLANLATKAGVEGTLKFKIHAPLIRMTKAQIIRRGPGIGRGLLANPQLLRPRLRRPALRQLRLVPVAAQRVRRGRADRSAGVRGVRIAEIFRSRQGEGLLTGTDSVFVRTSGCNLRCWFCDTPYTSGHPRGQICRSTKCCNASASTTPRHVVITGGEPMLLGRASPPDRQSWPRKVGTSRSKRPARSTCPSPCDLMSISPKLSNSTPVAPRRIRAGACGTSAPGTRRPSSAGCCATMNIN